MPAPCLLFALIAQIAPSDGVETSSKSLGLPAPTNDPLLPRESALDDVPDDNFGPGAWLPKVGEGLEVAVGARFGIGTDATESIRGDPPYGAVIDFLARLERSAWFAAVHWGVQAAGPEANPPNDGDSRQVFHPWEIGVDGGYGFRPAAGWLIEPQIGLRGQPDPIGPGRDPDISAAAQLYTERRWVRHRRSAVVASARIVGRYSPSDHDRASDRRLRRSTCFLWGQRFFDCAMAFTVSPGAVGAEGKLAASFGRFAAAAWGGWFVAGRADEVGMPANGLAPVPQNDGDWTWLGVRFAVAVADDIDLAAEATTGGRMRDSLDQSRVPYFTSDLARTAIVFHVEARL